jgi:glutamate/tyrosine decarboxylase-like PLP-dependent enzyme
MPDKETIDKFGQAVEEKKAQAKEASEREAPSAGEPQDQLPPEQASRVDHAHEQDDRDVRAKNSGHGQKTADKWNQ